MIFNLSPIVQKKRRSQQEPKERRKNFTGLQKEAHKAKWSG
jgi:hypothetical protein